MPRLGRLDFPGAIHCVSVHSEEDLAIFFGAEVLRVVELPHQHAATLREFERLIATDAEDYGIVLHGYSIEPNSCSLVLQTAGARLDAFMRLLGGQYSRYLHANGRLTSAQHLFADRYQAKVVAPEYLPHAVRRAHRAPVVSGRCSSRVDYPFSSERAYWGERPTMPVRTADVKRSLEMKGFAGPHGYREFMDRAESPFVTELFTRGSFYDRRVIGGKLFVHQTRHWAAHPPPPAAQQFVTGVARLMNMRPADIYSPGHDGVVGRALVASHALRAGVTLTEVGAWFSVTGATVGQAMHRYRKAFPDLFKQPIALESRRAGWDNADRGNPNGRIFRGPRPDLGRNAG